MRRVSVLTLLTLSWFLLTSLYGCTTAPTSPRSPSASVPIPPTATVADAVLNPQALELEAMLLLLADRRILEALVVDRALEADGAVRRRLALILGRIADPRGKLALAALLTDAKPAVRQAAAFALGRLPAGDEAIAKSLLRAVADADRETGVRAVESLARQGVTLATVGEALSVLAPNELLERLLPSLFRFKGTGVVPGVVPGIIHWAEIGLLEAAPHLRRAAAYGLAREPQAEGLPALRVLLADEDPWIAGWAARALGRVGERSDLARLMPLLAHAENGPVVQALRAAGALIARGAAAPDASWRLALRAKLDDPRVGVRIAALEVAGGFLRDEAIGGVLVERVRRAETGRERELALIALAEGGDPHAEALVIDAASDPAPAMRMRAAEAAGFVGNGQLLATLAGDADVAVRTAALAVRLSIQPRARMTAWAQAALADVDPGVRATVLDWAAEHPVVPVDVLVAAAQMRDRLQVAKTAGVSALRARAEAQAGERDQAIGALERLALARDFTVRRAARQALTALGRSASGPGPATQRPVAIYRDIFTQTHDPRFVDLETSRGTLRVRLACGEAPMTCLSFLQLAAQGFYNDLAWHRVIPDFVAQGGDPRGDGQGGPGYQLRDEPNLIRYHRGVLGMARSGPDTAGSQFFIALSRQPHLDGDYTAFGEVIDGAEVLDLLVQGDRILRITEVTSLAFRR